MKQAYLDVNVGSLGSGLGVKCSDRLRASCSGQ